MNIATLFKISKNKVLPILLSVIILFQYRISFLWSSSFYFISLVTLVYLCLLVVNRLKFPIYGKTFFYVAICAFVYFAGLHFQVSSLFALCCFVSLPLLTNEIKHITLLYVTNILSTLVGISLSFWILYLLGLFPFEPYKQLDLSVVGNSGFLDDYLFFVVNPKLLFPRFYAIYEEPGGFAVILTLVIIANRFDFRQTKNKILLLGLVFTFSLTGYAIFTSSLFFYKVSSISRFLRYFFMIVLLIVLFILISWNIEVLRVMIIDRILDFDNRGIDHRTSDELNEFFSTYLFSSKSLFGMGIRYSGETFAGSSYKMFLIDYGIVGFLILLLMYLSIPRINRISKIMLWAILLAFVAQGSGLFSWQILLYGVTCLSKKMTCYENCSCIRK